MIQHILYFVPYARVYVFLFPFCENMFYYHGNSITITTVMVMVMVKHS